MSRGRTAMMRQVIGALVASLVALPAMADDEGRFAYAMRPGIGVDIYLAEVLGPFRALGLRDGETIITRAQVDRLQQSRDAQWAATVKRGLARDPNGDGRIEGPEMLQNGVDLKTGLGVLGGFDRDGDGAVTRDEFMQSTDAPTAALSGLLALGDGDSLRMSDMLDHAVGAFKAVDSNGDLHLSTAEYEAAFGPYGPIQARRVARDTGRSALLSLAVASRMKERAAASGGADTGPGGCHLPKPTAAAEIVLLGIYEGSSLSSVHVGPPDHETGSAELIIEPGERPLYLVLAAHDPIIWRLTGAKERIERVVLAGESALSSGVAGLAAAKLALAVNGAERPCIASFHEADAGKSKAAAEALAIEAGRKPDRIGGIYELGRAGLPSMALAPAAARSDGQRAAPPAGFDPDVWRDATRFTPDGLAEIDPRTVAAATAARRYDVLPGRLGLAQLTGTGALRRLDGRDTFLIAKPIAAFPAGLTGSRSVRFVLGKGVPMPVGSPGHSCVVAEVGGDIIKPGARCR